MKRLLVLGLTALFVSACTMGVPVLVTPTVAPTITPSAPPATTPTFMPSTPPTLTGTLIAQVVSPTSSTTPTNTFTPSPTFTGTASPTPLPSVTPFPTITPLPTETLPPSPTTLPTIGASPTPLPSNTPLPTATKTLTWTPSNTPQPSSTSTFTYTPSPLPTFTPLPSATFLPTLTPIPSWTPRPTWTLTVAFTPQVAATEAFAPIGERTQPPVEPPTQGVAPVGVREVTPEPPTVGPTQPPATIDATPTFITAEPGVEVANLPTLTPITGEATPFAATPTALPNPINVAPTPLPQPGALVISSLADPAQAIRNFALSTSGTAFNFGLAEASTFAQNPVDPNVFVRVDPSGNIHLISDYAAGTESNANFAPFTFSEADPAANKARTTRVVWSRDGNFVAYLVDQWSDGNNREEINDGVWIADRYFTYSNQVFRDCHPNLLQGCIVNLQAGPYVYHTIDMAWGNENLLMVRLFLHDENRNGFAILAPGQNAQVQPTIYRYDYAAWSWDGTRVLVSGYGPDGTVAIRWFDPTSGFLGEPQSNLTALGLYVSYAVQRPDGQIVALAATGGAVHLVDVIGNPLSGDIGTVAPERVEWSPDRSAVLIVTRENEVRRYYLAGVNGAISEITDRVNGGQAVEWINQPPP